MNQDDLNNFVAILNRKKLMIAFAESVTAGMVCCEFSKALNVSGVLKGSLVAYSEEIKQNLLQVQKNTIEEYTAESEEVTREMASGLIKLYEVDIAVAVTGLANPGGSESKEKPVGTIFLCIIYEEKIYNFRIVFSGSRDAIIKQASNYTFQKLKELIK